MAEKIGKVFLDYTYYPGKDLYSDGEIEDELLAIAKQYGEEDYNKIIAERKSWPILYHFSHIRKISWTFCQSIQKIQFWKLVQDVERSLAH